MYSLPELQAQLAAFREKLTEATEHTNRALELLDEARRTIVEAYDQARPWVPEEVAVAEERLRADVQRLIAAGELIDDYRSRL
jgi:hypothetical protein